MGAWIKTSSGQRGISGTRGVIPVLLMAETSCAEGLRDDGSGIWDVSDVAFPDKTGSAPPGSGS